MEKWRNKHEKRKGKKRNTKKDGKRKRKKSRESFKEKNCRSVKIEKTKFFSSVCVCV